MNKVHVKKDDTVIVLSGDDKGVKGKVVAVSPDEGKVIVEKVNVQTKHVKPKKQNDPGGIMKVEGAIYASKVSLICPKCGKPARAMNKISYVEKDGKKQKVVTRVAAHKDCGYPKI